MLALPVIGLESEFKVFIDDEEVVVEEYWRTPHAFIERPVLKRTSKSVQLPTGGALYFDGGVLEVVTPVIEIAPHCTARVVRSLWDQIGFVRDELDGWERRSGHRARLQAFSCHFNISFELSREQRSRKRTIQKLAVLLSHLLAVPVIVLGANRRSTGIGVRPRRDRIEITVDFTPDPGLMAATTALIVGIIREVIGWPSYLIADAEASGVPLVSGLEPGPHPSRKGWVARRENFPSDPFTIDLDDRRWPTQDRKAMSLREIALTTALRFRESIELHADPFSVRLLFSVLRGETPALLDLKDRPAAYDDVGRATRWGTVLPDLQNFAALMRDEDDVEEPLRRSADVEEKLAPPWAGAGTDRRRVESRSTIDRRDRDRRMEPPPAPSHELTRSTYEKVFLNLGSGRRVTIAGQELTPIAVKGWYHALFRTKSGEERLLSIDQLVDYAGSWHE